MENAKMLIEIIAGEKKNTQFHLPFNPSEYTESLSNKYKDKPLIGVKNFEEQFTTSQVGELTLNLLFDSSSQGKDVREELAHLDFISKVDKELHIPPPCRYRWSSFSFQGVISSYSRQFTYFYSDGTPARVKVTLKIKPHKNDDVAQRENERHSADISRIHQLKEGESLFSLAFEYYQNPSLWRKIAKDNQIDDPLNLSFGSTLVIAPKDS